MSGSEEYSRVYVCESLRKNPDGSWTMKVNGGPGYGLSAASQFSVEQVKGVTPDKTQDVVGKQVVLTFPMADVWAPLPSVASRAELVLG